jgi:hypothetical protein
VTAALDISGSNEMFFMKTRTTEAVRFYAVRLLTKIAPYFEPFQ